MCVFISVCDLFDPWCVVFSVFTAGCGLQWTGDDREKKGDTCRVRAGGTVLQWGLPVCGRAAGGARRNHLQPHCVPCTVREWNHRTTGHTDSKRDYLGVLSVPPRGPSQPPGVRSLPVQWCDSSPPARWQTGKREDADLCQGGCDRGYHVPERCLCRWQW